MADARRTTAPVALLSGSSNVGAALALSLPTLLVLCLLPEPLTRMRLDSLSLRRASWCPRLPVHTLGYHSLPVLVTI